MCGSPQFPAADRFRVNVGPDIIHTLHGGAFLVQSESAGSLITAFLHQALLHDLFIQTISGPGPKRAPSSSVREAPYFGNQCTKMPMCAQYDRYCIFACSRMVNRKIFYFPVLVCAAVLGLAPASYAKTYPMTASNEVPGATAQLQVAKEKDGNSQLEVKANGMAKLTPAAKTYVVWIQQGRFSTQKSGRTEGRKQS
jgi:hypothetical protein